MIHWHRLLGLTLTDFFTGTAYRVELEKDLSLKQQLLDVVIIEREEGEPPERLPDGLENMAPHNLLTYKSHQQTLDAWTLDELIGHYVNYRKSTELKPDILLPTEDFQLYAVAARYPTKISADVDLKEKKSGVYDVRWGVRDIRIIVLSRVSKDPKNAIWHLFSAVPERVAAGASEFAWRGSVSSVINELFTKYKMEGIFAMPYTMEDFKRDYAREYIDTLTPEERLEGISDEELLKLVKKRLSSEKLEKLLEMLSKTKPDN
jgi:hypothetical protein